MRAAAAIVPRKLVASCTQITNKPNKITRQICRMIGVRAHRQRHRHEPPTMTEHIKRFLLLSRSLAMHVRNQIIFRVASRNYINPPEYWRVMTDDNGLSSRCKLYREALLKRTISHNTLNDSRIEAYKRQKGIMNKFPDIVPSSPPPRTSLKMSICLCSPDSLLWCPPPHFLSFVSERKASGFC